MEQADRGDVISRLQDAGFPRHVVTHVAGLQITTAESGPKDLLVRVLIGVGFGVGAFTLWPYLQERTDIAATYAAYQAGALLYDSNFGVSLVIGLFGWILVAATLVDLIYASSPRRQAVSLWAAAERVRGPVSLHMLRISRSGIPDDLEAERYVKRYAHVLVRNSAIFAAPLTLLSAYAVMRDVQTHSLFTPEAYVRSPFLPWGSHEPRAWASAQRVALGCIYSSGAEMVYEVEFPDGASVRIATARPARMNAIDAVELIDSRLRAANAKFERWRHLGSERLDRDCLAAYRRMTPAEHYARIVHLLRVGEL